MKNKLVVTFGYLLLAMIFGWYLRFYYVYPIEFIPYKYVLHAHSHVILLGWAFNALFLFITSIYTPIGSVRRKKFNQLFWFIQLTIILAMVGFLLDGYALFSILFSTLFLLGSFVWIGMMWKELRSDKSIGGKFLFLSLLLLLLSSLGPLSLGAIMSTSLKSTPAYPLSIYFYLHFLYNGFLIFGLIGVLFKYFDAKEINYNQDYGQKFYSCMKWSIIPLYALSAVWIKESYWINVVGGFGATIQIWGGYYFYRMIELLRAKETLHATSVRGRILIKIVGVVFAIKMVFQLLSSIQWVSDVALETKNYLIIGYIHLIMLGLISIFIFWYMLVKGWISTDHRISRFGLVLFLLGILGSELLLFGQGFMVIFKFGIIPNYHLLLFILSGLMPIGIVMMLWKGRIWGE